MYVCMHARQGLDPPPSSSLRDVLCYRQVESSSHSLCHNLDKAFAEYISGPAFFYSVCSCSLSLSHFFFFELQLRKPGFKAKLSFSFFNILFRSFAFLFFTSPSFVSRVIEELAALFIKLEAGFSCALGLP